VLTKRPLFLSLLAGLLFAFSWPETGGITFFIFIAFVPLLQLESLLTSGTNKHRSLQLFLYSYLTFFTWNLISTWWVKNASFGGAVMAIVFNSLFMALVFLFFHLSRRRMKPLFAPFVLACYWMAFEYLHLRWDLTWPWLTLGNVFAARPWMVQWYEYTGVFGGAVWIFLLNFMVFALIRKHKFSDWKSPSQYLRPFGMVLLALCIPIVISVCLELYRKPFFHKTHGLDVVVVQPNVDPYKEKFNGTYQQQLSRMLDLAETQIDENTACVAFPETALTENLWENDLQHTYSIPALKRFLERHPHLDVITGATSAYQYDPGEVPTATARKFTDADTYYDDFNTALMITGSDVLKYHKSKFVPGVERMPFPALLKPLEALAINMGGTTGSLCGQDERTVFISRNNELRIAPVICYESVFGEYVARYVSNGANIIFIITNDGWWGDTPGYKQHLDYARLRAIETRCYVARSANTGTSCFIDPFGNVLQATPWWKAMAIKNNVYVNDEKTFYVRHGDYIARAGIVLGGLLLLYSLILRFRKM
jgi:apolipoprotein N-acyltransferase